MSIVTKISALSAVLCLNLIGQSFAAVPEYELKAALLFKVARFIEWPTSAFENGESSLNFCILGENRFGDAIQIWQGKKIHGRTVAIRALSHSDDQNAPCHVLFVSDSEQDRVTEVLATWAGQPVLTVADINGFSAAGGALTFVNVENRIRFEINPETNQEAGLQVSAQLMQLATLVKTESRRQ